MSPSTLKCPKTQRFEFKTMTTRRPWSLKVISTENRKNILRLVLWYYTSEIRLNCSYVFYKHVFNPFEYTTLINYRVSKVFNLTVCELTHQSRGCEFKSRKRKKVWIFVMCNKVVAFKKKKTMIIYDKSYVCNLLVKMASCTCEFFDFYSQKLHYLFLFWVTEYILYPIAW